MSPPSRIAMAMPIAGLPLTRNMGCGGSGIGAVNLRNVAQTDQASVRYEVHPQDVLLGLECARYAKRQLLVAGLQDPRRADDVLRRQGGGQRGAVDPKACELLNREFDEDLLVLSAEDLDFRDVWYLLQPVTDALGVVSKFAMGKSVGRNPVNDPENVAEFVIEPWTHHTGR
jgi:hypothetical protein